MSHALARHKDVLLQTAQQICVWISSGLDLVDAAVDAKVIPGSVRGEGTLGVEGKDKIYSLKTKAWPVDPAFG